VELIRTTFGYLIEDGSSNAILRREVGIIDLHFRNSVKRIGLDVGAMGVGDGAAVRQKVTGKRHTAVQRYADSGVW